ncbi:Nicotinamidase (EC [Olavius algarvensis Delta 1 endosymbiont]|nr:Nicotinamidase (EC [Olavius algarvensis Delta 1 endosymbiont]
MDTKFDSYSGFADDGGRQTEMDSILKKDGIKNFIIYGLATDYCVKATAVDAVAAGYQVTVIKGLSKGVASDTTAQVLEDMQARGIIIKAGLNLYHPQQLTEIYYELSSSAGLGYPAFDLILENYINRSL